MIAFLLFKYKLLKKNALSNNGKNVTFFMDFLVVLQLYNHTIGKRFAEIFWIIERESSIVI